MKQQELKLPTARVPMLEIEEEWSRRFGQPHYGHEEDMVEMQVRLPKEAAAAIAAADPKVIAHTLQVSADDLMNDACTKWCSDDKPPCPGWWDVTDHKTGTMRARWWFGGVWWVMGDDPYKDTTPRIYWEKFIREFAWRGLKVMPTSYPAPPYQVKQLPAGARVILQPRGTSRVNWC